MQIFTGDLCKLERPMYPYLIGLEKQSCRERIGSWRPLIAVVIACSFAGRLAGQPPATDGARMNTQVTYNPQYRLRIMAAYYPGQGLRVVSVEANGPATNLVKPGEPDTHGSLDPGDVITRVDGQPVESLQNFYDLIKAGAVNRGKVVIRVRDVRTGQLNDWEATPVGGQGPGPFVPQEPGARHVHALLIALTGDPDLGSSQKKNLVKMEALVRSKIPAREFGSCRTLSDGDVTAKGILDAVDTSDTPLPTIKSHQAARA